MERQETNFLIFFLQGFPATPNPVLILLGISYPPFQFHSKSLPPRIVNDPTAPKAFFVESAVISIHTGIPMANTGINGILMEMYNSLMAMAFYLMATTIYGIPAWYFPCCQGTTASTEAAMLHEQIRGLADGKGVEEAAGPL